MIFLVYWTTPDGITLSQTVADEVSAIHLVAQREIEGCSNCRWAQCDPFNSNSPLDLI